MQKVDYSKFVDKWDCDFSKIASSWQLFLFTCALFLGLGGSMFLCRVFSITDGFVAIIFMFVSVFFIFYITFLICYRLRIKRAKELLEKNKQCVSKEQAGMLWGFYIFKDELPNWDGWQRKWNDDAQCRVCWAKDEPLYSEIAEIKAEIEVEERAKFKKSICPLYKNGCVHNQKWDGRKQENCVAYYSRYNYINCFIYIGDKEFNSPEAVDWRMRRRED